MAAELRFLSCGSGCVVAQPEVTSLTTPRGRFCSSSYFRIGGNSTRTRKVLSKDDGEGSLSDLSMSDSAIYGSFELDLSL